MGLSALFSSHHFWLICGTFVSTSLVIFLIAATFIEGANEAARQRHRKRVQEAWRIVFLTLKALGTAPAVVPKLPRRDVRELARYWIEHVNSVDGESRGHLITFASSIGLADKMRPYLKSRNPGHRVLAVCVAGWLSDVAAYPALRKALLSDNPTVAFTAAMALLRMDPTTYRTDVFLRAGRGDWGAGFITRVLRELRQFDTTGEVWALLHTLGAKQGSLLMQSWAQVNDEAAIRYARTVLANPANEGWLLCGALRVLKSPADSSLVRGYLAHNLWSVRLQAVNAIARFGLRQDVEGLESFMQEDNWWLQERALEAMEGHPQIPAEEAARITARMRANACAVRTS